MWIVLTMKLQHLVKGHTYIIYSLISLCCRSSGGASSELVNLEMENIAFDADYVCAQAADLVKGRLLPSTRNGRSLHF